MSTRTPAATTTIPVAARTPSTPRTARLDYDGRQRGSNPAARRAPLHFDRHRAHPGRVRLTPRAAPPPTRLCREGACGRGAPRARASAGGTRQLPRCLAHHCSVRAWLRADPLERRQAYEVHVTVADGDDASFIGACSSFMELNSNHSLSQASDSTVVSCDRWAALSFCGGGGRGALRIALNRASAASSRRTHTACSHARDGFRQRRRRRCAKEK